MTMKLPCAVVRDLLPLYMEKLTEEETAKLVDEHLKTCPECRMRLTQDISTPGLLDSAKPLKALKKEIRKRRWIMTIFSALLVFVAVYTYVYHDSKMELISWQDGLIEVEGIESRPAEPLFESADSSNTPESQVDVLVLQVDAIVTGIQESMFIDDDGTKTVILQAWRSNRQNENLLRVHNEMILNPVPDRLLYSVGDEQQLLWGTSLNGGVEMLPRLALAFYILVAAVLALVTGFIWFFVRNRNSSWMPRQIFFAPVSYLIAHFLIKGTATDSFFMEKDFFSIILITAALYVLISLAWQIWLQYKKER